MKFILDYLKVLILVLGGVMLVLVAGLRLASAQVSPAYAQVPRAALPYRATFVRTAHAEWGLEAPVAVFAGQIEQESRWDPKVCSAYACGLAQFTPATAAWISGAYAAKLGENNVFNPAWAIRAVLIYDRNLYDQITAATDCDRWGFTLSAYNGGLGNVRKDVRLCLGPECDRLRWFRHVELRSSRGRAAFRENRHYPRAILFQRQFTYATWGATVSCP